MNDKIIQILACIMKGAIALAVSTDAFCMKIIEIIRGSGGYMGSEIFKCKFFIQIFGGGDNFQFRHIWF
jgi:hypothetical protein